MPERTLLLCKSKCSRKVHILLDHLVQDEIGGAVEDACDGSKVIGSQALVQRTDDRDGTAHGSLKEEIAVVLLGCLEQDITLGSDQLLIGSRNALTGFEAGLYEGESRLRAAHALSNNAHVRVGEDHVQALYDLIAIGSVREVT